MLDKIICHCKDEKVKVERVTRKPILTPNPVDSQIQGISKNNWTGERDNRFTIN